MIKVGIIHNLPDVVNLVRRLVKHPDVEIVWMHNYGRTYKVSQLYPELVGEFDLKYTDHPDLSAIDLLIGWPPNPGTKLPDGLKSIFCTGYTNCAGCVDHPVEIGVPEFNRKALVRGARSAYLPDEITYLGSLALMPLAKNLLLGGDICGSLLLAGGTDGNGAPCTSAWGCSLCDASTHELREKILLPLQTSFNSRLRLLPFDIRGNVSIATFIIDTKMNLCDIMQLYHDFYDDHRHVTVLPENFLEVKACQVEGTNKSVIGLKIEEGRLYVSVAFDTRMKLGAGNIIHIMNLLFGLDERTGL